MLLIFSHLFLNYWNSSDRILVNTLLVLLLPLLLFLLYKYISYSIHHISIKKLPERNLAGKTIILFTPSLDSVALELAQNLSKRKVQLLIATPNETKNEKNLQLIILLREMSKNEEIYLENYKIKSKEETIKFVKKCINSFKLITNKNTNRLDSLIFLTKKKEEENQIFLILNIFLPFLISQLETGPPIRVIDLNSTIKSKSLWITFQHHLGLNPPLILIPIPNTYFDSLWALLTPIHLISPGLFHSSCKPHPHQSPIDYELLKLNFKSVHSIIQSCLDNKT